MRISEFKEAIDSIGFYNEMDLTVTEDDSGFCIQDGSILLAFVSKSTTGMVGTNYQYFKELEERLRQDLFDVESDDREVSELSDD